MTEDRRADAFKEDVWRELTGSGTIAQKIDSVLKATSDHFGTRFGLVAEVDGPDYVIAYAACPDNEIEAGARFDLKGTYCWHVISADGPRAFHHVADSDIREHPCYRDFGLETYIGTPLFVNGTRFGTVNFSSPEARAKPFSKRDLELVELVALWIGHELTREDSLRRLRETEERFVLAEKGSQIGIWDCPDLRKDEEVWSDQLYRILGFAPGEVEARASTMFGLVHPDDYARLRAAMTEHIDHRQRIEIEVRMQHRSGQYRWFLGTAQAHWDRDGKPRRMIGSLMDIDSRKRAETMKSEFVSTVSHELRTPMTSVMGVLGLIRSGRYGHLEPKAEQLLDIAHSSGDRLVRLINDLLDIEKVESGKLEMSLSRQDAWPLVRSAVEQARSFMEGNGVTVSLGNFGDGAEVVVDSDRFAQVLTNLLSNAAKFTPAGGSVRVELHADAQQVRVSVSDTGPGIPEDQLHRIFDRFTQVDSSDTRAVQGSGLGLPISRALIEALGGELHACNAPAAAPVSSRPCPARTGPKASPGSASRTRRKPASFPASSMSRTTRPRPRSWNTC